MYKNTDFFLNFFPYGEMTEIQEKSESRNERVLKYIKYITYLRGIFNGTHFV